ncbi:MAG: rod shape-determining protein MreD [Elusimicrobia bacterium RIFOXYB2_FULL_62_6]|nr:MAG: rod shape-determining protein MreD [Elusimicrobia bacterium RIFOXYB2_FULL_62_6]
MTIIGDILLYLLTGAVYWWWTANLTVFGLSPNIIFMAALAAAILARPVKAMAYGFLFGLFLDLLGSGVFGAYALTYTLMAYGVYILKRHFDLIGGFSQIIAALTLSVLTMLLDQSLSLIFAKLNPLELKAFLVEPFLNAALTPFVVYLFSQLKKGFGVL